MRLLNLLEGGQPIIAYHGSTEEFDTFNAVSSSNNYSSLGSSGEVHRYGIFFSLNPEFSKEFGDVKKYHLDINNLVNIDVRVEVTSAFVDYMGEAAPDLENDVAYIHNYGPKWELFDDEIGEYFSKWIQGQGYDSVQFHEDGAETIVVFDPTKIKEVGAVTESFFSDNMDVLMPVVKTLMTTGARPLIYKMWKKSPNAVLALAAIKRLHDKGDKHPLLTIERLSDIDVPYQFLRRLAWDAGLHDIPGVSAKDRKPGLMPGHAMESQDLDESDGIVAYHVTERENVEDILTNGFLGEWGDVGYGVYYYDNIYDARDYAENGGWDGGLSDPIILKVQDTNIYHVEPDPSWPNPEDYETVCWTELPQNEDHWMPHSVTIAEGINEDANDTVRVWHVTPTVNMSDIQRQGLIPQIGQNSADYGELEEAIHVFLNKDNMEDAIANWDMASWGEEDEVPLTAIEIELPQSWLEDDPDYPKMIALVKQPIPTSRFVNIINDI